MVDCNVGIEVVVWGEEEKKELRKKSLRPKITSSVMDQGRWALTNGISVIEQLCGKARTSNEHQTKSAGATLGIGIRSSRLNWFAVLIAFVLFLRKESYVRLWLC